MAPLLGSTQLRVSVVSKVATGCSQRVKEEAVQDLARSRLQGAGIVVSSVHDATLAIETDCVPVREKGRQRLAVQECVSFSELVNPANGGRPALAERWRQCEAYTCDREKCEAARPYEEASVDDFLNYYQERTAAAQRALEAAAAAGKRRAPDPRARVYYFGAYVMCCLSVLVFWQFRGHPRYRLGAHN
jgi:hypothetical protein